MNKKRLGRSTDSNRPTHLDLLYATCKFLQQTSILCIIRGQSHRHYTALGRRKIPSQTPPKGQGRPTFGSQTGAVGLSRQANHKTRTDFAKKMRENVKSGVKCVTSWAWSQFSLFLHPNAFTSSLFIICAQLVYLQLSGVEKIYLRLSLIISTYCVIFTRFPELIRGIINNKRWENLLADAKHVRCECLLTRSDAQTETGWVLHQGSHVQ